MPAPADNATPQLADDLTARLHVIAAAVQARIARGQIAAPAQAALVCPADPAERAACDSCQ